jgi:hypothetical protein
LRFDGQLNFDGHKHLHFDAQLHLTHWYQVCYFRQ